MAGSRRDFVILPRIGAKFHNSTLADPYHDVSGLGKVADFAPRILVPHFSASGLHPLWTQHSCDDGWLNLGEFLLSCPGGERNSAIPRPPIRTTTRHKFFVFCVRVQSIKHSKKIKF